MPGRSAVSTKSLAMPAFKYPLKIDQVSTFDKTARGNVGTPPAAAHLARHPAGAVMYGGL